MSQITLYLDDETDALLNAAVASSGLSKSRWVAQAIRQHSIQTWPADFLALAGRFTDFPLIGDKDAQAFAPDVPRIGF
jgi:hypothetical protein